MRTRPILPQAPPPAEPKVRRAGLLILAGSFYLGLALAHLERVNIETELVSSVLGVSLLLALAGWHSVQQRAPLTGYYLPAFLFSGWFFITAVAVWGAYPIYRSLILALWLLFVVPGLAALWTDRTVRNAFIIGVTLGIVVYGVVAVFRLASGEPVHDVGFAGQVENRLLGVPRNAVNLRAVLVVPILVAWDPGHRGVLVRWVGLVFLGVWLVTSGGRSGIVGTAVSLLLYAVLQPGASRRLRAVGISLIFALAAFLAIEQAGGTAQSTNRLMDFIRGERTSADDIRELAARKAWHAGLDSPLFGLGPRSLSGYFHPVLLESDARLRVIGASVRANAHNTYAEVLAQSGFPGALAFLALLALVFIRGVRASPNPDARVATAGLGGVMTILYFNSALSLTVFYGMALVLAASIVTRSDPEDAGASQAQEGRDAGRAMKRFDVSPLAPPPIRPRPMT